METDEPAVYEICIKARLTPERAAWFEGLSLTVADNGQTLLRGVFQDQAALHGVLAKIRDLGLPLLKVERVSNG